MKHPQRSSFAAWLLLVPMIACSTEQAARPDVGSFAAPPTRAEAVVDDYHGTEIADPYRWLEDQDGTETAAWVDAQSQVTDAFLDHISPGPGIEQRLSQVWNYEKYTSPSRYGDWWIYRKNDGLQNHHVIYKTRSLDEAGEVLLDPNTLSEDGTASVGSFVPTVDGRLATYSLSRAGSDWREWHVLDLATGEHLDDVLLWSKFGGASWSPDGKGFYYTRYPAPAEGETYEAINEQPKLCYHRIGTPQDDDAVVYERPDEPRWGFYGSVTEDGKYLIIRVSEGTDRRNRVATLDLSDPEAKVIPLLWERDASYGFVGSIGSRFYFSTDNGAPRGRVISLDRDAPGEWTEIIPEAKDTLTSVRLMADRLALTYIQDAHHVVRIHGLDGKLERQLDLPRGSVTGLSGRQDSRRTFFGVSSFVLPGSIYSYDFDTAELAVWRSPELGIDPDQFVTKQVFFQSKDGTRVPMFLVHKKGIRLDGENPTLLFGYGGFNISLLPRFSPQTLVWLERGGIYAQPTLRGGGEYGKDWHHAGMLHNKQNVFDDFIAAAEYLIRNGYTSREKLGINGRSNGGLLVGACLTQRPDLFGCALPEVGVLDMLRYHKFTIGWAWVPEYGSADDPEMFPTLLKYSPLHRIENGTAYPPTLVLTGDHDDRVLPGHSYKFAAALQRAQGGSEPVLIRIETQAGHGGGTPTHKLIEAAADRIAFLEWALADDAP